MKRKAPKSLGWIVEFFFLVAYLSCPLQPAIAQEQPLVGDPIITRFVYLEHADAENLAAVLAPLLTREGKIVPYPPLNLLIIKDRASRVKELVRVIKGPSPSPLDKTDF